MAKRGGLTPDLEHFLFWQIFPNKCVYLAVHVLEELQSESHLLL